MATIEITLSVKITESDGHTVEYTETRPDVATGGNPLFFAEDVERGIAHLTAKVSKAVVGRFGRVRREVEDTNYVARTFA